MDHNECYIGQHVRGCWFSEYVYELVEFHDGEWWGLPVSTSAARQWEKDRRQTTEPQVISVERCEPAEDDFDQWARIVRKEAGLGRRSSGDKY